MSSDLPIVISASRRTDIPAFYMPWFVENIRGGYFESTNPFNGRKRRVAAGADRVHTIVFWSKNFRPFLQGRYGEKLEAAGYHLFFNFTINSRAPLLEPRVPHLSERLQQLEELCRRFGAHCINWRFDPICFYRYGEDTVSDNLGDFERIAAHAACCRVTRCITSFVDLYAKVHRRAAAVPGFAFIDPPLERKRAVVLEMEHVLRPCGIQLSTCCEKALLGTLPPESRIHAAACVPNDLLVRLFGGRLSLRRDGGQRRQLGCGCRVSVDIGSYRDHPCYHNCLFCYANPSA